MRYVIIEEIYVKNIDRLFINLLSVLLILVCVAAVLPSFYVGLDGVKSHKPVDAYLLKYLQGNQYTGDDISSSHGAFYFRAKIDEKTFFTYSLSMELGDENVKVLVNGILPNYFTYFNANKGDYIKGVARFSEMECIKYKNNQCSVLAVEAKGMTIISKDLY